MSWYSYDILDGEIILTDLNSKSDFETISVSKQLIEDKENATA